MNDPKFEPNQYVRVNKPGSPEHGRELQIEGVKVGVTEWRYSLWGSDTIFKESELQAMESK